MITLFFFLFFLFSVTFAVGGADLGGVGEGVDTGVVEGGHGDGDVADVGGLECSSAVAINDGTLQ